MCRQRLRTIYDTPTRALLKEMLAGWDFRKPVQVFTTSCAIAQNYRRERVPCASARYDFRGEPPTPFRWK